MKIRSVSLITALILLFSALIPVSCAEMDYGTSYETAIRLASNDLSNIQNLNDAVVMLEQTGAYLYSKSYLMYFQALLELQKNDDFDTAGLRLKNCSRQDGFVADLQEHNLPSCEELLKYIDARELEAEGKIQEAYAAFVDLSVLDSPDRAFEIGRLLPKTTPTPTPEPTPKPTATPTPAPTLNVHEFETVGNIVAFGHYEQDNNTANGREAIEWIVLDYDEANHKALLISKYGLDAIPYNEKQTAITWGKCTLRTWLNGAFLKRAFSAEEQSAILITNVDNGPSQGYSKWYTNSGNNTQDQIFLLSCSEANHYLGLPYDDSNNKQSRVAPTAYAIAQGAYLSNSNQTADGEPAGRWWLRSPGDGQSSAADASSDGSLSRSDVSRDSVVVRPAFWLDLESDLF